MRKTLLKGTYSSEVKTKKGSRTIIINQQIEETGGIKSRMKDSTICWKDGLQNLRRRDLEIMTKLISL